MANFAKLNSDNIVMAVHVVDNDDIKDSDGVEQESLGIAFLQEIHGWTDWKQTSYNAKFRKNYAGIGYKYDSTRDAFISPQPFSSWTLNETNCQWKSPVDFPTIDDNYYIEWDEANLRWAAVDNNDDNFIWNSTTLSWDAS